MKDKVEVIAVEGSALQGYFKPCPHRQFSTISTYANRKTGRVDIKTKPIFVGSKDCRLCPYNAMVNRDTPGVVHCCYPVFSWDLRS